MKQAIVTGGAGLIGTGIRAALTTAGWRVASFDLHEGGGGDTHVLCDVSDEASVEEAFDTLGWDGVDLLVNNAGAGGAHGSPVTELTLDEWRRITDSHLTGTFLMSRAAIPRMRAGASIVNIASTRAYMSEPHSEAYAAAKGGIVALTHALAISLGPGIRVNGIAPGWITAASELSLQDNTQHPVGRVGRPHDIGEAVIYLTQAGFVTGQILVLDGGMTRKMIYAD